VKTLRVSFVIGRHVQQGSLAYRDEGQPRKPLGSRIMDDGFACRGEGPRVKPLGSRMAKVNAFPLAAKRLGDDVRGSQVKGGEELRPFVGRTLMASILDKAFKGEL